VTRLVPLVAALAALEGMAGAEVAPRAATCDGAGERLDQARGRLSADARDGRVWAWGWGIGFGALAVGQGALGLTRDDAGQRAELYVGAGKTVLGLVPVLLVPVPAVRDAARLDERLAAAGTPWERCALLPEAERMLARSADDEAFARSWLAHAATVAVNAGGLLIVGVGYDRWVTGTVGALVGTAVGELQIFTRPTGALRGRREDARRWTLAPLLDPGGVGLLLAGWY
jgi:hypothetical protein